MKTTPFLLAMLLLLTFSACKKDEDNEVSKMIKTVTEEGITTTYTYDDQNRLVKAVSTNGEVSDVTYSTNLVTVVSDGETTYYNLNSAGQAISTSSGNGTTYYAYNSDGTMRFEAFEMDTTYYTWANGNITSTLSNNLTTTYTYYTDQENTLSNTNVGLPYLDATSKDLLKSTTCVGCFYTTDVTYDFDSENRVTKRTETSTPGPIVNEATYTYY